MRVRIVIAVVCVLAGAAGAVAQRRAFDLTTPTPIATLESVWIEELTWMEVRDAMNAGKTAAKALAVK